MTASFRWGASSEVGLVRQINEDSKWHDPPIFAVADGMGGHSAGDVASALAIEVLVDEFERSDSLDGAVRAANKAIYRKAQSNPELAGMGTTITALYANEGSAQIAHVGDSRAYLLRGDDLGRLTQDHTVVNRLVQQGRLMKEDADRHPQRSYLERALGVDSEVEVDVHVIELQPGDRVLLCSDGLFGMIEDELIQQILQTEHDPQRAADRLSEEAIHAGGNDNVTTVVVDVPAAATGSLGSSAATTRHSAVPAGGQLDTGPIREPPGERGTLRAANAPRAGPDSSHRSDAKNTPPRRGKSKIILTLAVLVLLAGGALFATQMWLSNSWFVGSLDGRVTIFKGVQGNLAGFDLSDVERETDLASDDLSEVDRIRLERGIPASSSSDANRVVAGLEAKVTPSPSPSPEPAPPASDPAGSPAP